MSFLDLDYNCLIREAEAELRNLLGETELPEQPTTERLRFLIEQEGRLWRELRRLHGRNSVWREYFSSADIIDLDKDDINWNDITAENETQEKWAKIYKKLKEERAMLGIY